MKQTAMTIVLAIVLQPIFVLLMDAIISWSIYVCQEVNHSIRKFIYEIKYMFCGLK